MCPDRQIISLYLDGELPSPWKGKLETHLSDCPKCRAALAGYRNLGQSLRDLPEETVKAAQERVWKKITAPKLVEAESAESSAPAKFEGEAVYRRTMKRVWSRRIILPLPAAAAAAVIIIIAFFALMGIRGGSQPLPQQSIAAANIGLDDYTTVPVQDMNDVLRYVSSQDNGDFMVVRLPETKNFSRIGEPTLINAADYSRRNNTR